MESFFSSVKSELRDRFDSCGEAKMELFDYIEVFYNQRRRHSTLGQISPGEFEQRAARHLLLPAKRTGRTAIN
jgi:putative transposase